jgi:hypothetical protein
MPVVGLIGCEGPFDAPPGQARLHIFICGDIKVIVESYEFVTSRLPVDCQRRSSE